MKQTSQVNVTTKVVPLNESESEKLRKALDFYIEARVLDALAKMRKAPQPRLQAENGHSE